MIRLEEVKAGTVVRGITPEGFAKVVGVDWYGEQAIKVVYEESNGAMKNRLLYRDDKPTLEIANGSRAWSFDGEGALLRLVSEALRGDSRPCNERIEVLSLGIMAKKLRLGGATTLIAPPLYFMGEAND